MQARCIMWVSMSTQIHRQHEKYNSAREILLHLQELFGEHSRTARYEISKRLFRAKMREGEEVGAHVNSMIRSIEELERDRKSTRLNSSHSGESRMPSSA